MKAFALCTLLAGSFLGPCLSFGQQPGSGSPERLSMNSGKIVDGVYSNECLGFSWSIPAGWDVDTSVVGADASAKHIAGGGLTLLYLRPQGKPSEVEIIHFIARDTTDLAGSAEEYVSNLVHQEARNFRLKDGTVMRKELVQDAEPVEYGGKRFFRAEFKQSVRDDVFYVGHVYTTFRGYFIGEDFVARSPEEMDKTADTLKSISFREDERNPRCVEDSSPTGRVRLSETASQVFLITKIEPVYPPEARQTRVEGQVVLRILIGTTGDVEDTHLVSGDPLLVPAAMDAVKHWKYRPFLIGSEPVKMDTQITVSFTLAPN